MKETLNYGMVGGSLTAFIGGVHRVGVDFDGRAFLKAGCFSQNQEKNQECARFYQVDADRTYSSYQEMAKAEGAREDGIDFVTITAPNDVHYEAAKAFLKNGIHVLCEKPLCFEVEQAEELKQLAEAKGLLFCECRISSGVSGGRYWSRRPGDGEAFLLEEGSRGCRDFQLCGGYRNSH